MEGWVAVTHSDWFDVLARQPHREKVNIWSPSDYYAFHGTPGSPFFFKLKAPRNAIGGFGYVASFTRLPEWLALQPGGEKPEVLLRRVREWFGEPVPNWLTGKLVFRAP